jgi:aminopeptidase N
VQHYLEENAWKTARADDLFKALDFVSAQRVGELASSFLDRPGVPEVLASWTCGGSGSRLELRESEWRPLGGGGDPARTWKLPVCITSDAQKTKTCFTLGTDPITRDLGPRCPMWVYPNAEQAGYYRFVVERAQLLALAAAQSSLGATDRLGLLSNAWAGVRQAAIEPSTLFEVLSAFDAEMNRHVVDQIVGVLQGVDHMLVDDDARSAFQKYASARLAAKKRALGWEPSPKEDDDRALERRTVLWAMGEIANDKTTLGEAEKYCAAWLRDPERVPNDVAAVAVPLASLHASDPRIRLQELRAAAKRAKTPEDRVIALRAMGAFEDPAVLREAFELTLADELKLSELHYIFGAAVGHRVARPVLYAWEKESWAKLRARMPGSLGGGLLVEAVGMTCSPAERDDARAFSASASRGMEGVKRRLEEALESADLCIALRRHGAADVTKYLKGR